MHSTLVANILQARYLIRDVRTQALELLFVILLPYILSFLLYRMKHTFVSLWFFVVRALRGRHGLLSFFVLWFGFKRYLSASRDFTRLPFDRGTGTRGRKESKFYRKAFSTYVPPQLVAEIIKDPAPQARRGEKDDNGSFFRHKGFHHACGRMPPDELVSMLNE